MSTTSVWTTKDKRKIPVGEMSDGHLIKAARMMKKITVKRHQQELYALAFFSEAWVITFLAELDRRKYQNYGNRVRDWVDMDILANGGDFEI